VLEYLPSIHEALGSILNTKKVISPITATTEVLLKLKVWGLLSLKQVSLTPELSEIIFWHQPFPW
jgi:hypothetical protein